MATTKSYQITTTQQKDNTHLENTMNTNNPDTLSKSNWCVYSHFNTSDCVLDYVIEATKRLKREGFEIIFVSTSALNNKSLDILNNTCHRIIVRENKGYDFGSYKVGIDIIKKSDPAPQKILLTNDSVYGPTVSLKKIIDDSEDFDIYGITDSIDGIYHIQSYFILYSKNIINSKHFDDFWCSVELLDTSTPNFKLEIIRRYEIGGSQYFIERGFKLGAAFPIDKLIKEEYQSFLEKISAARKNPGEFPYKLSTTYNSLHYRWKTLAESGCPYVKRELLAHNPAEVEISDWPVTLEEHTDFPVEFIIQSICNHLSSDDFIYTTINKLKLAQLLNISGQVTLPISPAFSKFAKHFSWEPSRTFLFDEDYYLRKYPDVDHVIKLNGMKSAVYHFLMYGYSENRSVRLIRTYNQANTTQPNNKEI